MSGLGIPIPIVETHKYLFAEKIDRRDFCQEMAILEQQMKELSIDLRVMNCQTQRGCATVEEAMRHWDTFTKSPLVTDLGPTKKMLNLHYDCSRYDPSEIIVVFDNDKLWVHACREKKGKDKAREFHQAFPLSKGVQQADIKPTLTKEGVLVIQVPLIKPDRILSEDDKSKKGAPIAPTAAVTPDAEKTPPANPPGPASQVATPAPATPAEATPPAAATPAAAPPAAAPPEEKPSAEKPPAAAPPADKPPADKPPADKPPAAAPPEATPPAASPPASNTPSTEGTAKPTAPPKLE